MVLVFPIVGSTCIGYIFIHYNVLDWSNVEIHVKIIIYGFLACTMALGLTPTTLVAYLGGYVLGFESVFYISVSYFLAQYLGYKASQFTGSEQMLNSLLKSFKKEDWGEKINASKNDIISIAMCRLSPALPFGVMNYVLGMINVPIQTYLWGGFLGMLPRTLFFTWVGARTVAFVRHPQLMWHEYILGAALAFLTIFYLGRKILAKK